MASLYSNVTTTTPKAYDTLTKFVPVARTDTTAFVGVVLPKYAIPVGYYVLGRVASNAATTANINVGTSATATELVNAYDVKTAATATGYSAVGAAAVGAQIGVQRDADTPVYFKYAETGTASTAGGPWIVKVEYLIPGPGENIG
jgi:hypothetical protein